MGKNVFFKGDMSLSVNIDSKNKDILILGEELTQRLDDTTLTTETNYPINMTQPRKKIFIKFTL